MPVVLGGSDAAEGATRCGFGAGPWSSAWEGAVACARRHRRIGGGGQGVEVAPARADPPPSLGQLPEFLYSICDVEFLYSICNVEFVEFVM